MKKFSFDDFLKENLENPNSRYMCIIGNNNRRILDYLNTHIPRSVLVQGTSFEEELNDPAYIY